LAVRGIVLYGSSGLREICQPVSEITDEVREFISDMFATLKRAKGLGLSAPQVGDNRRIFILDLSSVSLEYEQMVFINPEILEQEGEQVGEEGCLSFPGLYLDITRAQKIVCEFTDLGGNRQQVEAEGLPARAIQHELDHLNGKLFIDHLRPADRELISGKLKKIKATC
jgi:peptide deformylase